MGIIRHKDAFNPKYQTAIVIMPNNKISFVSVQHTTNGLWQTNIEGVKYLFSLDDAKEYDYKGKGRILIYHANHAVSYQNWQPDLEIFMKEHNIKQLDADICDLLSELASRESPDDLEQERTYDLGKLKKELITIADSDRNYASQYSRCIKAINKLGDIQIKGPLVLLVTSINRTYAKYKPELIPRTYELHSGSDALTKRQKVNKPLTAIWPWFKMTIFIGLFIGVIMTFWVMYDLHYLDSLLQSIGLMEVEYTDDELYCMAAKVSQRYPMVEDLVLALDANTDSCKFDELPTRMQSMVEFTRNEMMLIGQPGCTASDFFDRYGTDIDAIKQSLDVGGDMIGCTYVAESVKELIR